MSPLWASIPPTPLGHHRAPSWAPCAISNFPLALYFTHDSVYMSILSQFVPPFPTLLCPQVHILGLYLYFCTDIYIYIYIFWYMIFVFLSDLLHSVWQTQSSFTSYKWPNFIPFYGWVIFHCIYVHLHPFICQWTSRLLPCPGYCK